MSALNRACKHICPIEHIHVVVKFLIVLILFLTAQQTEAAEAVLEREIHNYLKSCLSLIDTAIDKCQAGKQCNTEISQIKKIGDPLKTSFLLLSEGFKEREKSIATLGQTALKRHQVMADGYRRSLNEYLALIDSLSPQADLGIQVSTLKRLQSSLGKVLHKKQRPILGSLPYRNLNYPVKEPASTTPIVPAYKGGNKIVAPDDLQGSPEAPVDKEIAALAQTLNWSPVEIYEYVKNNIETEWYWGSMKGAVETLNQKSGNDADQAALLVALLRASGFPARYVRGTIEFFPGLDKVQNLTGIDDPAKIAIFFQTSGIPFKPVISGGRIINFQIEHVWVEAQIPYSNYRGAIIDEHGKAWLGLDTGIKVNAYQYSGKYDIAKNLSMADLRDEFISSVEFQEPLEFIKTKIQNHLSSRPELFYGDLLRKRTLPPEEMQILPASLQFDQKRITHEYTTLPDELKHKIKLAAHDKNNAELLTIILNVQDVSSRKVELSYEPETIEDQQIINSYGGLDNTPSYLVKLRPVVKVDDERMIVAQDGLAMGEDFSLKIDLISPNGAESSTGTHIAGNLSVLGIVVQKTAELKVIVPEDKGAAQLLYEEAINYVNRWNRAEDELTALLQLNAARPTPTVVVAGGVIEVTYLLDQPHGYEWKGVYLDARVRTINVQPAMSGADDRQKIFMQMSALQGSVLENRIFEDDFKVDSVSTAKLMEICNQQSVSLVSINKENIAALLPTLPVDENVKQDIANAINQDLVIKIPNQEIAYQDWQGIGYIKENPETAEAGYMLSGMVAGGMTAWSADKWPGDFASRLANAYNEPPVYNPAGDYYIEKITAGDLQAGTVGKQLSGSLQVKIYTINKNDGKKNPVPKKDVTFKVIAGGGTFADGSIAKTVKTDVKGIAGVDLILGKETKVNRAYMKFSGSEMYFNQVGENIVTASLASGLSIQKPFTAYGKPDLPHHLTKTHGDNWAGAILTYTGFLSVLLEDQYGNPISNKQVTFARTGIEEGPCPNPNDKQRQAELILENDLCLRGLPMSGQCASRGEEQMIVSSPHGAAVGVILGGVPQSKYLFKASVAGIGTPAVFSQSTFPFGACNKGFDPFLGLHVTYLYPADEYGNSINAGKVGSKLDLQAMMYFLAEKESSFTQLSCDPPISCTKVAGGGEFSVVPAEGMHSPTIAFGAEPGKVRGNGLYAAAYMLQPGVNTIKVNGGASIQGNRTTVCPACQTAIRDITLTDSVEMILYGVNIIVDPIVAVLVDQKGYTRDEYKIKYTITPAEYKAASASIFIYKNGIPIAAIPAETQGSGWGTIARGFRFDLIANPLEGNSEYEVEVILNYGSRSMDGAPSPEISSGRKKLVVAALEVESKAGKAIDTQNDETVDFGSGLTDDRTYRIILESESVISSCSNNTLKGKLLVIDAQSNTITTPDPESYGKAEYDLDFSQNGTACQVKIKDGETSKEYFVRSNRKKEDLIDQGAILDNIAVLFAGADNRTMVHMELITDDGTKTLERIYPGKPLQVIVLAIDGLRQDVLYGADTQPASYADAGCGNASCYVPLSSLPGLSQILTTNNSGKQYIMLPDVTAIFPSVTLASWASVFTGKMPKETGITGNEFYARDVLYGVPTTCFHPPMGMVTFDGGAFPGYGECCMADKIWGPRFIVPYRADWREKVDPMSIAPNDILRGDVATLYETLTKDANIKNYYDKRGGDSVVVAYSHYARGASRWLTHGDYGAIPLPGNDFESKALDRASWSRLEEYLDGQYMEGALFQNRNKRPFPALTVWYLPGLDHEAHIHGMGSYKAYFKDNTDYYIKNFVKKLKAMGEFDNKVFIIVADHGETAMPFGDATLYEGTEDEKKVTSETSCELNLEGFNKKEIKDTELANNNLHIWELANLFSVFPSNIDGKAFKLLVPNEIAQVVEDSTTTDINHANIIAALNGPMAHIYVKGADWQSEPDADLLDLVLDQFEQVMRIGNTATDEFGKIIKDEFPNLGASIDTILVRRMKNGPYEVHAGQVDANSVNWQDRISGLNDLNRSGDIILIMKDKMIGDAIDRFTVGVACKSWHGSLNPSDSYVPLIAACPGGNKADIEKMIKKEMVCKEDYSGCQGNWRLTDIVKEVITNQYTP